MLRFISRRLLLMTPMLLVALTVTFAMVQMAPGSPFSSQRRLPPEIEANLKAKYGFDQPKLIQYTRYMARLVGFRYEARHGYQWQGYPDFGDSTKYKDKSVNQIIKEALPVSAVLGLFAYAGAHGGPGDPEFWPPGDRTPGSITWPMESPCWASRCRISSSARCWC